jgi:unsaturated chondroitin disaccharide hydrolase
MQIPPGLFQKCTQAYDFAEKQLRSLVTSHPDFFPFYTQNGKWKHSGEVWTHWCEGFLGGQLWLIYQRSRSPWWRSQAEHYSRLLEHRKSDRSVHDLGFLFWSTWKRWYDLEGDASLNQVLLEAGQTMGKRFQEKGGYLHSFLSQDSLFIDIMMNVGIIFYAAQQTGNTDLYQKAHQHCLTTRRFLVRGDGSTSHEGIFNLETGEFLRQSTKQGWRSDSCWARGLAWSLYGFGTAYSFTRDARFLSTAESCAAYYIEHTPNHGVPPNDYDQPDQPHPYESSAAAIAASGLLDLAAYTGDLARANLYRQCAYNILDTLAGSEFLAVDDPGWEGILKHGIYHLPKQTGVDESVAWGDYFFLEAAGKVLDGG